MTLSITIVIMIIFVAFVVYGSIVSQKWHSDKAGNEVIQEKEHFYGRIFYYNPDDKRILPPKRSGGGYTVNFANPLSIIAILLIIGGFLAIAFLQ